MKPLTISLNLRDASLSLGVTFIKSCLSILLHILLKGLTVEKVFVLDNK